MKRLKMLLWGIFMIGGMTASKAQVTDDSPVYYVDVLIDTDYNIYVQEKKTGFEELTKEVRSIVYNISASKYQGVVYRIYGDKSLKMGNIIDVGAELIRGYDPIKVERYLLNLEDNEVDGSNYIERLKELDLKAIDP